MTFLYSSVGAELTQYHLDVDRLSLVRGDTMTLPAPVQYCWPHPGRQFLYVVSGHRGERGPGVAHFLNALRIGMDGALQLHGPGRELPMRPLHVTIDGAARYIFTAYNDPAGVTVHRIAVDGSVGEAVPQSPDLDTGIFPHQIRVMPGDQTAILVTRGNDATATKPEDPGALLIMAMKDGVLSNRAAIAPGGGYGFGPRHLDIHPAQPWVYVSLERQNALQVYAVKDGQLGVAPSFHVSTLARPGQAQPRQLVGTVHVHPDGHTVYVANRADHTHEEVEGPVFSGGENSIAVFRLDTASGKPRLVQHADTRSFHVRTFAIDPTGRMLVAASIKPMRVREGEQVKEVAAALSVFRIGPDGLLKFARKYDVETGGRTQFWMGMV